VIFILDHRMLIEKTIEQQIDRFAVYSDKLILNGKRRRRRIKSLCRRREGFFT
jgi:hypothetical protein